MSEFFLAKCFCGYFELF